MFSIYYLLVCQPSFGADVILSKKCFFVNQFFKVFLQDFVINHFLVDNDKLFGSGRLTAWLGHGY